MSVSFIVSLKLARLPLAAIISVKRELAILGRLRTWMQVTREASPNVSNEWRKKKKIPPSKVSSQPVCFAQVHQVSGQRLKLAFEPSYMGNLLRIMLALHIRAARFDRARTYVKGPLPHHRGKNIF